MAPLRILQVVTIMNRGGLETMLMNYYRQIDRNRIQFDFLVHREDEGHYDEEIRSLGGHLYRMPPIRPGNYRRYDRQLTRFFTEHPDYAWVHAHINENSSFVLRAARRAGVPGRIAHSHLSGLGLDWKLPFRIYARMVMNGQPNRYFACSRQAGEWLFGRGRMRGGEVTVLNNAVNAAGFAYDAQTRKDVREEWQAGEHLVVGHIGRFVKQKNHEFLLDVFHALVRRRPDSLLILAGDGPQRSRIERKVQMLGLQNNVRFLGIRKDVARLMQGMDLFLFPSRFEGLPVVLVEAQAAGLTCIASDRITRETDVTGRVAFISLDRPPEEWVGHLLNASCAHLDTSEALRQAGYDATTMASWLERYYLGEQQSAGFDVAERRLRRADLNGLHSNI